MNRYLPAIVFAVVAIIGLGMTLVVNNAEEKAIVTRFEVVADEVVDRVRERISQHMAFLDAAHAFYAANRGDVSRQMFATFIESLELKERFKGIQGMGFARMIQTGAEMTAEVEIERNYGIIRKVWPETDESIRTPIVVIEPSDARNEAALGYDMFAEQTRRAAMVAATSDGMAHASAPVELVQEITPDKQAGFLVYIPLRIPSTRGETGDVIGFVYAPFRAGDLHTAALSRFPQMPAAIKTVDVSGSGERLLFEDSEFEEAAETSALEVERTLEVAGRNWKMTIRATPAFRTTIISKIGTFALGAISILLAIALAVSTRAQLMAVAAARELQANTEKSLGERELMLQEMKHRIKNSIARMLAIARHTAAHSETIDDFSESFTSRLQAMANAQDMLTRSHWQRTDLQELLSKELDQVFGADSSSYRIEGDQVELNERATQALGLVFHELATNALKYGGVSEDGGKLTVNWHREGRKRAPTLVLDWLEETANPAGAPEKEGFGTRLIDANIRGELGGQIHREFTGKGMTVQIRVPPEGYR